MKSIRVYIRGVAFLFAILAVVSLSQETGSCVDGGSCSADTAGVALLQTPQKTLSKTSLAEVDEEEDEDFEEDEEDGDEADEVDQHPGEPGHEHPGEGKGSGRRRKGGSTRRRRKSGGGSEKPEVKACEGKEEGDKCSFGHGFLLLQHPGDGPHIHEGVCVDAGHKSLLQHPGEPGHKHLYCKVTYGAPPKVKACQGKESKDRCTFKDKDGKTQKGKCQKKSNSFLQSSQSDEVSEEDGFGSSEDDEAAEELAEAEEEDDEAAEELA